MDRFDSERRIPRRLDSVDEEAIRVAKRDEAARRQRGVMASAAKKKQKQEQENR